MSKRDEYFLKITRAEAKHLLQTDYVVVAEDSEKHVS